MFRKWNYEKKQKLVGFSFILPWLIGFCAFTAFPLGYCFYMALNKVNFVTDHLEMQWLGFENFRKVLYEDAEIPNKLMQTFQQSLLIVPLIVVFALIMALMLNSKFPGRAFYRAVFFLPVMLTSGNLISTLTSQGQGSISFLQSGTAAQLVAGIGGTLGETLQTVLDNFLVILWYSGVQMLLLIAGMQSINPSTYEAAKIDGAGTWEVLWTITLPGLMPFLFVCVIYTIVDQFTIDLFALFHNFSGIFLAVLLCQNLFHRAFEHPEIKTVIFHITFPPLIDLQTQKTQSSRQSDRPSLHPYTARQSCGRCISP